MTAILIHDRDFSEPGCRWYCSGSFSAGLALADQSDPDEADVLKGVKLKVNLENKVAESEVASFNTTASIGSLFSVITIRHDWVNISSRRCV